MLLLLYTLQDFISLFLLEYSFHRVKCRRRTYSSMYWQLYTPVPPPPHAPVMMMAFSISRESPCMPLPRLSGLATQRKPWSNVYRPILVLPVSKFHTNRVNTEYTLWNLPFWFTIIFFLALSTGRSSMTLNKYTSVYSLTFQFTCIWDVSSFSLLRIHLLWPFLYKSFSRPII